jgi:hypothetical protein
VNWDLARRSARDAGMNFRPRLLTVPEYTAIALSAIGLSAAESGELTETEMRTIGYRAISSENAKIMSMKGRTQQGTQAPRFAAYWSGRSGRTSFEETITDRIALNQVWSQLDPRSRQVLQAYSDADTNGTRAKLAGVSTSSWATTLDRARKNARTLWYFPEEDPGHYPYGRKRRWAHT